ncbi:hypothetical protein M0804_010903 [Polistes exclamans]|nr:hypothetical protein M0804_010903 [Polistes exclamans]
MRWIWVHKGNENLTFNTYKFPVIWKQISRKLLVRWLSSLRAENGLNILSIALARGIRGNDEGGCSGGGGGGDGDGDGNGGGGIERGCAIGEEEKSWDKSEKNVSWIYNILLSLSFLDNPYLTLHNSQTENGRHEENEREKGREKAG